MEAMHMISLSCRHETYKLNISSENFEIIKPYLHDDINYNEDAKANHFRSNFECFWFFIVLQGQDYHLVLTLQYQSTPLFEPYLTLLCMEHLIKTGFDHVCELYQANASGGPCVWFLAEKGPGIKIHYPR